MLRRLLPVLLILSACGNSTVPMTHVQSPTQTSKNTAYQQICVQKEEQKGPWENPLDLQWIDEKGKALQNTPSTLVEAGGVPTLVQEESGRLVLAFQWFSCEREDTFDKVAVMFSEDEGKTWTDPTPIQIENYPNLQRPFDPTLAILDDGRIRMYYTSNPAGTTQFGDDTNIYSAISEDAIHYTFEEGIRFDVAGNPAYDSAVGYWDGLWHMITPNNRPENTAGAHYGTSTDGLTFTMQDDLTFTRNDALNWTGNFDARADGLYFYGTPGKNGNWFTRLGEEGWDKATSLTTHGGDPAVTCVSKNRCLMISVGMPTL